MSEQAEDRAITVREAGRRGGLSNSAAHDRAYFVALGKKAAARMRELVARGRQLEEAEKRK